MVKTLATLFVVLCAISSVLAQNDCNNPLLGRSEIISRYGGSANILTTPTAAPASLPICKYLAGNNTCVNSAGYTAFASALSTAKQSLVNGGQAKDGGRFGNISGILNSNPTNCYYNYAAFVSFVMMSAFGGITANGTASANTTINYQSIVQAIQASVQGTSSNSSAMTTAISELSNIVQNFSAGKAKCAKHLIEVYVYSTCLAGTPGYSNKVQGTTSSPIVRVKQGYCASIAGDCASYISGIKILAEANMMASLCSNSVVQQVGNLILNTAYSSSVNTQLNQIWQNMQTSGSSTASLLAAATNTNTAVSATAFGASSACESSVSSASACNFVCESVLNATGYKANAFNDVDPSENSRLLQSSSFVEVNDPTLDSPNVVTANEDTTVTSETASIASGGTATNGGGSSSGLSLIFNMALIVLTFLLIVQ
jgi:hypothetical protein